MKDRRQIPGLCALIVGLISSAAICATNERPYRNYGPIKGVFLQPEFACAIAIGNDGNAIPTQRFAYWPDPLDAGTYQNEWTIKHIEPYLQGGQQVNLLFFAEGYLAKTITTGADSGWLQISLDPEATITGQITAVATGAPLADAYVVAAKEVNDAWMAYLDVTDTSGHYKITNMEGGGYELEVYYPAYNFPTLTDINLQQGDHLTGQDLAGTSGRITGTVSTYGGSPIEAAYVLLSGLEDGQTVTDSSGHYEFVGLVGGNYILEAIWPEGINSTTIRYTYVSVTDGQTTVADLIAGGGSISGTVLTTSQQPVVGAKVLVLMAYTGYTSEAVTGSGGMYSINHLQPGTYLVTVDPQETPYVASRRGAVQVTDGITTTVNFELGPEGRISGRITDSPGNPISSALVTAVDPCHWTSIDDVWSVPAATDAQGCYTIRHLRQGSNYAICAKAENFVSDSTTGVSVIEGQTTAGIDFSLAGSGGAISGTVYQSDGQTPVSNAIVAISVDGKSWGQEITESDGMYRLSGLQGGTYRVFALAEGYTLQGLTGIEVTESSDNSGNDFTLTSE